MALFTKSDAVFYNGKRIVKAYQGSNVVLDNWTPAVMQDAGYNVSWYDPNDLRTVFLSDGVTQATPSDVGQPVGMIKDKGNKGRDYSQTNVSRQPLLAVNNNGVYYLDFDGIDDLLSHNYPYLTSKPKNLMIALTMTCIVKPTLQRHYGESNTAVGTPVFLLQTEASKTIVSSLSRNDGNIMVYNGPGTQSNTIGVTTPNIVRYNDLTSSFMYYVNGVASNSYSVTARSGNYTLNTSAIGYQVGTTTANSNSALKFYGGVMATHATDTMSGANTNIDLYLKRISKL